MFIETERLIIRSLEPGDAESYIEMAADGSLQDIFGDCTNCREWMESWIAAALSLDRKDDPCGEYLAYAVTEKQSGAVLGSVGCSYYEDLDQVGITFFIGSACRGNGYASEAVRAYAGYFFAHYAWNPCASAHIGDARRSVRQLIATVREDNTASWKTLEKAGFILTESRLYRDIHDETALPYRFYVLHSHGLDGVLSRWGLQDSGAGQIYDTAWQIGSDYVLKVYHDREMLERNLKMLRLLYGQGIPVARIIPTQDNTQYASCDDAYYFLSEKLPGSRITQIDGSIARSMGEIIARLHVAFRKCEPLEATWDNSLLDEMNGWVMDSMEKNQWKYISQKDYLQTVSQLAAVYDRLPVQLIHRDIHFGNFLFADGAFSGYIDFDLSQRNIRIFDLCYFVLGLLCEEESFEITEDTWFIVLEQVFDGYEKIQTLTAAEKKAIPCVMECIELLFTAWFADQKDDGLAQNAMETCHFVRKHQDKVWKCLRLS